MGKSLQNRLSPASARMQLLSMVAGTRVCRGAEGLEEGQQSKDGCEQSQGAAAPRERRSAGALPGGGGVHGLLVVLVVIVTAAGFVAVGTVEAERLHAALHVLADGPLRAVARARLQLLALGDSAQVGDHVPAAVGAGRAAEKFPTVVQIVVHGGAALRVPLALVPGLRAARAGSPGEAGLDGPFGEHAHGVLVAAAVLQSRAIFGHVELDQGVDAVAGTLLLLPVQHGPARAVVVVKRVIALGLGLTPHDGLPANQPSAVGRRSHGEVAKKQQRATQRQRRPAGGADEGAHRCGCGRQAGLTAGS